MVREASANGMWLESTTIMTSPDTDFAGATREPEVREPDRATLTRALRELEAAQARVERDARRVHEETRTKLVMELLPVLDNLDRTIRAAADNRDGRALVEGVRLVRAQLESVLRGYGIERIDAVGARFDPSVHEAIQVAPIQDPV